MNFQAPSAFFTTKVTPPPWAPPRGGGPVGPPLFPQWHFVRPAFPARRGRYVHAGAPPTTLSARARARNAKQNAPRTFSCSTRARVVRFVSRFSRARADVPSNLVGSAATRLTEKCRFRDSGGGGFLCFFEFLGFDRWPSASRPHTVYFWTKNIFCPDDGVFAKFEHRSVSENFYFPGIAAC